MLPRKSVSITLPGNPATAWKQGAKLVRLNPLKSDDFIQPENHPGIDSPKIGIKLKHHLIARLIHADLRGLGKIRRAIDFHATLRLNLGAQPLVQNSPIELRSHPNPSEASSPITRFEPISSRSRRISHERARRADLGLLFFSYRNVYPSKKGKTF